MASVPDLDRSFVPTSHRGLTYPFGGAEPGRGAIMPVAAGRGGGVGWVRLAMWGPLRHVNCWLLADGDRFALVDTGFNRDDSRAEWKQLAAGPLAKGRISRVIGTHLHPDHIGLAGWMCRFHDAPLLMTRGEYMTAQFVIGDAQDAVPDEVTAFRIGAGWSPEQVAHAAARGWAAFRRIVTPLPRSYTRLRDGDRLDIGGRAWRVIVGSGHSPEHACLLDEANGIFVAGDQVLPRISPNVSVGFVEPDADPLGEWFDSIAKLKAQVPGDVLVLPGHGDPFTGLHARLDAMDREHRGRLDDLETLLADAPRRAVDTFSRLFRRAIDDDMLGMATGEALAHLRRLEVEGRAIRETRDGVWWWRTA